MFINPFFDQPDPVQGLVGTVTFTGAVGSAYWKQVCITPDGNTIVGSKSDGKVYVSRNGGASFAAMGGPTTYNFGLCLSDDGQTITAVGTDYCLYTAVGGTDTLVKNASLPTALQGKVRGVDMSADGGVMCVTAAPSTLSPYNKQFYVSVDKGSSWLTRTAHDAAPLCWLGTKVSKDGSTILITTNAVNSSGQPDVTGQGAVQVYKSAGTAYVASFSYYMQSQLPAVSYDGSVITVVNKKSGETDNTLKVSFNSGLTFVTQSNGTYGSNSWRQPVMARDGSVAITADTSTPSFFVFTPALLEVSGLFKYNVNNRLTVSSGTAKFEAKTSFDAGGLYKTLIRLNNELYLVNDFINSPNRLHISLTDPANSSIVASTIGLTKLFGQKYDPVAKTYADFIVT